MGRAVRFATAGVVLAVALTTSACGVTGAAAPVAGAVGATSSATSAPTTATTSDDVPLPDDTSTGVPPFPDPSPNLHEGELRAALLPPSVFGSGMQYDSDSPHNGQFPAMNLPNASAVTCDQLVTGGPDSGSIAYAYAGISDAKQSGRGFFEAARQYANLGAAATLGYIEGEANGACTSYDDKTADGTPEKIATTLTAKSGIGDTADFVEQVTSFPTKPYPPQVFDSLVVEYGDLLVTVACSGSRSDVKNCDLVTKAKAIASKLISQ